MVDRIDADRPQGIALQVQRLRAVGLRDAGVADQHVSQAVVCDRVGGRSGERPANGGAQITMRSISSTVTASAVRS